MKTLLAMILFSSLALGQTGHKVRMEFTVLPLPQRGLTLAEIDSVERLASAVSPLYELTIFTEEESPLRTGRKIVGGIELSVFGIDLSWTITGTLKQLTEFEKRLRKAFPNDSHTVRIK